MDFATRYKKLNRAQQQAVDTIDGPVMVIAGPGTGKTELLSMRAANILQKTDTLPESILCLTFTESGATAMRNRLASIIGPDAYKVAIHTFHSFGTEIINQNSEFFYNGASFKPADDLSCYEIMRTIFDGLEYDNPLAAKSNDEYTHLGDTLTVISELKKSGLTSAELLLVLDANDQAIDKIEPLLAKIFAGRISKDTTEKLAAAVTHIKKYETAIPLPGIVPLAQICGDSLQLAVDEATEANSTKPITAWRNAWLKKNDAGNFILKARERQTKLRSVSFVYYQYLKRMEEEQLFDFDDMIMQVVHAMEVSPDLCFNLQERYLYIMVDEFQDTNLAQMRILYNLVNSEVNAGRPNILVVGDDDQAIYSFQGANVGNINAFLQSFDSAARITLTDNYRSAETILKHAREVITLGQNRLENTVTGIDKTLTPHYKTEGAHVHLVELPTQRDERQQLVDSVQMAINRGAQPGSIAVIARRHHELVSLLPYFVDAGLPVNYERRDNVLDNELIQLIEHITQVIVSLFEGRHDDANALLPELCAHPAFGIAPRDLWQLSLDAHRNHQTWLEVMAVKPTFMPLFNWLVTMSQSLSHDPLEIMLDQMIGLPNVQKGTDSEYDDDSTNDEPQEKKEPFVSPLFGYFFSEKKQADNPDAYLSLLEALRTIRTKLRNYQPNEIPTLQSFLEFIRLHRKLGSPITSIRSESEQVDNAVNLMTAHKSKGLEFDTVFIIGAVDSAWGERVRSRSRLIGYPENLPLAPSGDTLDERLRLFFVAMTRARRQLVISYSTSDDSGKAMLRASFLTGDKWQPETIKPKTTLQDIAHAAELSWYQPLVHPIGASMRELLASQLATYRLSSTHLNNFLDVSRGGPHNFLLSNLLRFPQAMSPHAAFGSAIHAALQHAQTHLLATGSLKPLEDILRDFEEQLRGCRLGARDFDSFLQKGTDALTAFTESGDVFTALQKAELNFASQGVQVGDARLTGSLDLVAINEEERTIIVTDYKTGRALRDWNGKTDYDKIKLHKYRQQLMFYNLLVRHSRDYGKYAFQKGVLQFVEPTNSGEIISLETSFSSDELEEFAKLIGIIWNRIITLDLPDTSSYESTYKGMLAFEQDLLNDTLPL